jgi:hypothetical protein
MIGCKDYLSDLAWYVGVSPKDLANGVRALKIQSEEALKAAAEVQRNQADQERVGQLESLPSVFIGGQAFLAGLQNQQPPEMATLLLHMLANLPSTLGERLTKLNCLVVKVKSSFGVVVQPYYWDKGQKTFEWVPESGVLAPGKCRGKCMSTIPHYKLTTDPN